MYGIIEYAGAVTYSALRVSCTVSLHGTAVLLGAWIAARTERSLKYSSGREGFGVVAHVELIL